VLVIDVLRLRPNQFVLSCSFSKLPKNWAEDTGEVEASWRQTERALRATVDFVRSEIGWTTRRWLPSTLVPVVYLLAKNAKYSLKGKDANFVKRYLLVSGYRSLFRGDRNRHQHLRERYTKYARRFFTALSRAF